MIIVMIGENDNSDRDNRDNVDAHSSGKASRWPGVKINCLLELEKYQEIQRKTRSESDNRKSDLILRHQHHENLEQSNVIGTGVKVIAGMENYLCDRQHLPDVKGDRGMPWIRHGWHDDHDDHDHGGVSVHFTYLYQCFQFYRGRQVPETSSLLSPNRWSYQGWSTSLWSLQLRSWIMSLSWTPSTRTNASTSRTRSVLKKHILDTNTKHK